MATQQVPTEEEIIAGAIADTEQEIFDDALGQPEDDGDGDTSLEEMDDDIPSDAEEGDEGDEPESPDAEGEEESDDPDATAEQDDEAPQPPPEGRERMPYGRLRKEVREETERRRQVEQERDTLRAQLAAFQVAQAQQPRPQPQQEQPAKPDFWSDPEAWAANQRADIVREFTARHVNAALSEAHEEHGEEFVAAYRALTSQNPQDPVARAAVQRIWDAPNPGKALMRWHGEQQILRQAGGDPQAYRQQVAKEIMSDPEFRQQILADMRGEAQRGDGGRPRTSTRLPKSLNGASGGGSVRTGDPDLYNNSEDSVFAFAMK
jgi:hypothetical protein